MRNLKWARGRGDSIEIEYEGAELIVFENLEALVEFLDEFDDVKNEITATLAEEVDGGDD